ncbi:alpha-L-rhamnosidase [Rathayibacter festucae]|uniref:alpha-L-rhamnosidase n=1 Tax=Rathayibacter festucae TaxID=110937 RepID=UPI002A6AB1BF|nr:family 78 glycoside hydrolase catalytic domain [Rathayibacter festucae]MDY0914551.1 family 78 glycoside hydrolase catalytic domain [Rathayibacter festucae]
MTLTPTDLRVDGRRQPLGLGSLAPEFSWLNVGDAASQSAWELEMSQDEDFTSVSWSSGRTLGGAPFGHCFDGVLDSAIRYHWRIRVWADEASDPSPWSASWFETGILHAHEWSAEWVAGALRGPKDPPATLYLSGSFGVDQRIVRARAYVSSLGWHRFLVNGEDQTGPALVPRWTPLDDEVEYITYDVTRALHTGCNALSLVVGDGRYRGALGFESHTRVYGDRLAGLMQLVVTLEDGSTTTIVTDETWHAGRGSIVESDPKFGERVDLRRATETVDSVVVVPSARALVAEGVERVQEVERLAPNAITRLRNGDQVVDFGQNFAGVVAVRLRGPSGTTVTFTHSEVTTKSGAVDVDYLRMFPQKRWTQRDTVVLDGEDVLWQPWFTIHGFRFVQISGLARDLEPDDVSGVVISTALGQAGEFECSNERLNRLWSNVGWSVRSNFTDTPTDCPTRERSGWTGDIQVFARTAATMVDVQWYLRRFLHNLALEQAPDGTVPVVIPSGFSRFSGGPRGHLASAGTAAGWGDASVLVPWTLYQSYGDERVLADQYDSMVAWVESCARRAREKSKRSSRRGDPQAQQYIVDTGFQYGEWLRPGESAIASAIDAGRRGAVVATAYFEHSARTLSTIAAVLEREDDRDRFLELADSVRNAWRSTYLHADGRIGTNRQDDYVRAIAFGLLTENETAAAATRLVSMIDAAGGHLSTGFLSTPLLLDALINTGHTQMAWKLLLSTSQPSWLHQVDRGATTVWETWEGYSRSGRAKMSHNHYALGSAVRFLPERIAGITPLEPGYRVIGLRPLVGGGITRARARLRTPYGDVESSWHLDGEIIEYRIVIPAGTTGQFRAGSDAESSTLEPGTHVLHRSIASLDIRESTHL